MSKRPVFEESLINKYILLVILLLYKLKSVDVDSQVADLGKKVKALEKSDNNEENISKFEWVLLPVGLRVVAIRHNATNLYIAMNSSGQIYATEQFGKECKFKENVFENYWCFYSSIEFKNPESGVR